MEIPEFKDPNYRFLYNQIYPTEAQVWWAKNHIYEIWPELEKYDNSIYVICASLGYPHFNKRLPENVAEEVRDAFANGKRNFIFNCLGEGLPEGNIEVIHKTVGLLSDIKYNISIIYVTGAFDGEEVYLKYCQLKNITPCMYIISGANFEKNSSRAFLQSQNYITGRKEKKFLCFNKENRQHRITLFNKLLELDLVKESYYSFSLTETSKETLLSAHHRQEKIIEIIDQLPLVLNRTAERDNPVTIWQDDIKYFDNSYFSVITETLFYGFIRKPGVSYMNISDTYGNFPSEKIYKAFAMRHPFIVVSTYGFLKTIKDKGYKTFSPFIDESYDTIEDDDERMEALVSEIHRLCNLTETQLIEFTNFAKPIVDHNFNVFSTVSDFKITKDVLSLLK